MPCDPPRRGARHALRAAAKSLHRFVFVEYVGITQLTPSIRKLMSFPGVKSRPDTFSAIVVACSVRRAPLRAISMCEYRDANPYACNIGR